jgi:hypothetical protein
MAEIRPITKTRTNQKQNYKFRGIDDIYAAVHPLMAKHGVINLIEVLDEQRNERTSKNDNVMIHVILKIRYDFVSVKDGSKVSSTVVGEAMDYGDKACNKAMSVAHKYAFVQMFTIRTDEIKDTEHHSPQLRKNTAPRQAKIEVAKEDAKRDFDNKVSAYTLPFSSFKGKRLDQLSVEDLGKLYDKAMASNSPNSQVKDFLNEANKFLGLNEDNFAQ